MICQSLNWPEFDPAPFAWLQGIIGLCALLIATGVLSLKAAKISKITRPKYRRKPSGH
jgi:hypothetical protein